MRFLCLHGGGTSGEIFKSQTANLRHAIGDNHSFDFVDGGHPCHMAPELGTIYPSEEYLMFCKPGSASGYLQAISELEDYVESDGPFDGVIGFSHGAHIAAALVAREAGRHPVIQHSRPGFKCAIFLCGWPPYDSIMLSKGMAEFVVPACTEESAMITIPTAHIFDPNDKRVLGSGASLRDICKAGTRAVYTHECGHEVPSFRHGSTFFGATRAINKTIEAALVQR